MNVDLKTIETLADRLFAARQSRKAISPIRLAEPALDVASAYAVQKVNIQRQLSAGDRCVGRKIGLTSKAVQTQLGVDQPDFGVLLESMGRTPGATLAMSELIAPRIEGEIVFRVGRDIMEGGLDCARLAHHIGAVASAFEIVDSAIAGWDISIVDTVADNASCGTFVVGLWQPYHLGRDLKSPRMALSRNGDVISTGSGAATLGDPLNALLWLAETSIRLGDPLRAGEFVLAGALGPMVPLMPGIYSLEIEGFPKLQVSAA